MPLKRVFVSLLILLLGAVVVAMIAASLQTRKMEKVEPVVAEKDNITAKNVSFKVTEGSHKKWAIDAKEAIYFTDNSGATLKNVEGEFYNTEGKAVMRFTAPQGVYYTKDQKVTLTGGVKAFTLEEAGESKAPQGMGKNVKLLAPKMGWSARSNQVLAEGGVTMTHGEGGKSQSDRCRFTLDLSTISLDGHVRSAMSL